MAGKSIIGRLRPARAPPDAVRRCGGLHGWKDCPTWVAERDPLALVRPILLLSSPLRYGDSIAAQKLRLNMSKTNERAHIKPVSVL
jgi:hypothetical protein